MQITKQIKLLSVNDCWAGRRFKTPAYKAYEAELLYTLPKREMPKPPYKISFEFGFSSESSDWDNPIKPLQDILQEKYNFNDKDIHEGVAIKKLVKKGQEYFKVRIDTFLAPQ